MTFGEGMTPLLEFPRLGSKLGFDHLLVKEEGLNPTGSFKARGMAVAVSRALELGIKRLAVPSAGNAGAAMAAYAARAGLEAWVFMPSDTPRVPLLETRVAGGHGFLVNGLINDAGKIVASRDDWFAMSTLREPYRAEGKKTMGYEIAEQLNWELPDAIVYPTGGGTGLVGMWKAFDEMETLGWIGSRRPKMFAVQSTGCAPIVRAFESGATNADLWQDAQTIASGLRVPVAIADYLVLSAIRASGGIAIAVTDAEIMAAVDLVGAREGLWMSPEGAATVACLPALKSKGHIRSSDRIVLFNCGSGLVYPDLMSHSFQTLEPTATSIPGMPDIH